MISEDVRQVEKEIDAFIQKLPIWAVERDVLLHQLIVIWRDGLEMLWLRTSHALTFGLDNGIKSSIAMEHLFTTGVYQTLKWVMLYAKADGKKKVSTRELTTFVVKTAPYYQILVDALKLGAYGKVTISVDRPRKTLTIYEGGNISGHDQEIVDRGHVTQPLNKQNPLVEDSDQLTADWTAGQFREYWKWLKGIAEGAEKETIVAKAGPLGPLHDVMKRPVVLDIPQPPDHLMAVQRDLTLTTGKVQGPLNWKIDSWHDCPLVQIGERTFGISLAIKTLAVLDDYMLRTAVLNDPAQYQKVSGLREKRMIEVCRKAFSAVGWTFTPHFLLANPAREIDGYATKGTETCIVQLKSTLRPQSPWEVYKRNTDVIEGITHTSEMVRRIGLGAVGIVITDGYAGDYATWQESIRTGIAVATLEDLELIAKDPVTAFTVLSDRAGIKGDPAAAGINERSIDLCGWRLHMVDEDFPVA